MLERLLSTDTFLTAQGAMDGLASRHAAISDNIANVNTPGYKRKSVPFEAALAQAVQSNVSPCTGSPNGPIKPFCPTVVRDTATEGRGDGNNVDIEQEVVQLADNSLRFEAMTEYVTSFFSQMKSVINGGK